ELSTLSLALFFSAPVDHRDLRSFPTRRSSDLALELGQAPADVALQVGQAGLEAGLVGEEVAQPVELTAGQVAGLPVAFQVGRVADRKSTRLNSSHDQISYAVFCLKKKSTSTAT